MSSSKRHFRVVIGNKENGLYISSTPSSAARKAVSKLCADNKKKKVEFSIREITQGSNKKVYGPYIGYMQKLDNPIELEGRVIRYKPIVKRNNQIGGSLKVGDLVMATDSRIIEEFRKNKRINKFIVKDIFDNGTISIVHINKAHINKPNLGFTVKMDKVKKIINNTNSSSAASAASAAVQVQSEDENSDWVKVKNGRKPVLVNSANNWEIVNESS
jgi:hypothetical protein